MENETVVVADENDITDFELYYEPFEAEISEIVSLQCDIIDKFEKTISLSDQGKGIIKFLLWCYSEDKDKNYNILKLFSQDLIYYFESSFEYYGMEYSIIMLKSLALNHDISINNDYSPCIPGGWDLKAYGAFIDYRSFFYLEYLIVKEQKEIEKNLRLVMPGLNEQSVEKFKTVSICNKESKDDKENCSVCLGDYSDNQKMTVLDCKHKFHNECISQWLKKKPSCPICRRLYF